MQTVLSGNDHDITPRHGSIRKAVTGQPVDGLNPVDYPLVGVCLICGRPIRIERYFLANWTHIGEGKPDC